MEFVRYDLYAIEAHGDQQYGDKPYEVHLKAVAEVMKHFGYDTYEWQAAAWLHDTIEDTNVCYEDLEGIFGENVAKLVWACTGEGRNRKERQACIIKRLHEHKRACPLKLADRIANLEAAIQEKNVSGKFHMYFKELSVFEKAVRKHVPEPMWDRLEEAFDYGKTRGWC